MNQIKDQIRKYLDQGRDVLTVFESKQLLLDAGFPINQFGLASNPDQAASIAKGFGFPVVLKIVSSNIVHKSDIGGVAIGIGSEEEVILKFKEMMAKIQDPYPKAQIDGILVENMIQDGGTEVILGTVIDPVFDHVVMFGLGGIFVEVLKDVTFRLIPMKKQDALDMIEEIRAAPILNGVRGQPPANKEKLANLLIQLSEFVNSNKEIAECDLNPVFAGPNRATVVDARLVLKPWPPKS